MTAQPAQTNPKLLTRYRDGYRVAKFVNTIGQACKVIGALTGFGIFVVAGLIGNSPQQSPLPAVAVVLIAVLIGFILWVVGVFLAATGQMLKATLDAAVNSSPFLSDADKLTALS